MDQIVVRGGNRLVGEVAASGSKNSSLALMASALAQRSSGTLPRHRSGPQARSTQHAGRFRVVLVAWRGADDTQLRSSPTAGFSWSVVTLAMPGHSPQQRSGTLPRHLSASQVHCPRPGTEVSPQACLTVASSSSVERTALTTGVGMKSELQRLGSQPTHRVRQLSRGPMSTPPRPWLGEPVPGPDST